MKSRLLRYWCYFRRGHGTYLMLAVSFLNFVVIQYRLLISYIPFLRGMFSGLTEFAVSFAVSYIIVCVLVGWWDYKRGGVIVDSTLITKANPYTSDSAKSAVLARNSQLLMMKALILIAKNKREEAINLLENAVVDMNEAKKLMERWSE